MVPKQFLKWTTREGYGRVLFYDWRYFSDGKTPNPEFVLNSPRYKGASILLARANFGCGSSREHVPWAILDYGFRAVIAPSFADIFYNNCFKNGVLLVTLPDAEVNELFQRTEKNVGYRLSVDLENRTLSDDLGLRLSFQIDPFRREYLLKGLDDIGLTLRLVDRIAAFEESRHPSAVMYEPVEASLTKPAT
jgi:3-isopropylmalate/(R)-2-methylmalate dehydratase small subunit